jgi:hypothetical protein
MGGLPACAPTALFVAVTGTLEAMRTWLKHYKSPQINSFGFGEKCEDREYAETIATECHEHWRKLVQEHGARTTV